MVHFGCPDSPRFWISPPNGEWLSEHCSVCWPPWISGSSSPRYNHRDEQRHIRPRTEPAATTLHIQRINQANRSPPPPPTTPPRKLAHSPCRSSTFPCLHLDTQTGALLWLLLWQQVIFHYIRRERWTNHCNDDDQDNDNLRQRRWRVTHTNTVQFG